MKKLPPTNSLRRDVHPIFQWLRDRALGRKNETGIRFEDDVSDRTQPPPNLPEGPSHKLYGNYYFLRDPRRLVETPLMISGPDGVKKLPVSESQEKALTTGKLGVNPGKLYNPPIEPKMPSRDPVKSVSKEESKN